MSWDASSLGKTLSEIFKKLYGNVVPDLYPKLEMGSRPLKGDEAEVNPESRRPQGTAPGLLRWRKGPGPRDQGRPEVRSESRRRCCQGSAGLPHRSERLRQSGRTHGQETRTTLRWHRLRLGPGHAAADPGRAVPGRVHRGLTGRREVHQLQRPPLLVRRSSTTTRSSRPCSRRSSQSTSRRSPVQSRATKL